MTDEFKQPDDDFFYEALVEQGKTADCVCRFDWAFGEGGRRYPKLLPRMSCPVHYPQTSKLFNQVNERREQED